MERPSLVVITLLQIVAIAAVFWMLVNWTTPWNVQRYVGTALVVAGVCGIAVARYQLGRSFSIRAEAHQLVTSGLYSRIRNPIYVFGIVMMAGIVLVVQRPALWIVVGAVAIGQTLRARREAKVLEATFGDTYREYRRRTWF
jgi:protein-S-isoprenylcysteine O-methyltransferase Ste14